MNSQKLIKSYKGKNVYITGITGFKGSWLALMLYHLGANVHGIGLKQEDKNSIFHVAKVDEIAHVTIGDIMQNAHESKLIKSALEANPDYIFHMAAQPIVSEGYADPFNTFQTNIMGTVVIHELLRGMISPANKEDLETGNCFRHEDADLTCKKISFVNVTTDKVYQEKPRALKETDVMFGFDPYSLSKTCSDMISTCYRDAMKSEHLISTMRSGNVIGGGDMSKDRIIPGIVNSAVNGETLSLRSPESVRPYQHVFDSLTSYLYIAALQKEDSAYQGEYNVGPDLEQTMTTQNLVERMSEHINFNWDTNGASIGKESDYLMLDNNKIKEAGWKPVFDNNSKVVESTAIWYKNNMQGKDMQEFTLKQIENAFSELK